MKKDIKTSYTAADTMPIKTLINKKVINSISEGKIPPIHAQLIPTNKCNLHCEFCSCSERDQSLEMKLTDVKKITKNLHELGSEAVTITGGGEPLTHPEINEIISEFASYNIKVGLVTNGFLLNKLTKESLDNITWCRISNGDTRKLTPNYERKLHETVEKGKNVDWAFSHVVSEQPNLDEIVKIITFANQEQFTHVRLVSDLFQPENVSFEQIKAALQSNGVDDDRVIYQERKQYEKGGPCYIGFLKPLIGPDCKVYLCCGVQYALPTPSKDLPEELCLGSAFELDKFYERSKEAFDGSICNKCYYMNYNRLLGALLSEIDHKEFV